MAQRGGGAEPPARQSLSSADRTALIEALPDEFLRKAARSLLLSDNTGSSRGRAMARTGDEFMDVKWFGVAPDGEIVEYELEGMDPDICRTRLHFDTDPGTGQIYVSYVTCLDPCDEGCTICFDNWTNPPIIYKHCQCVDHDCPPVGGGTGPPP